MKEKESIKGSLSTLFRIFSKAVLQGSGISALDDITKSQLPFSDEKQKKQKKKSTFLC